MIALGEGVALAGIAISAATVIITAIRARAKRDNPTPALIPCLEHSGTLAALKSLQDGQARIDRNIERIFTILDSRNGMIHP